MAEESKGVMSKAQRENAKKISLLKKQQNEDDKDIEQMESMWKKMHDALTYEGKYWIHSSSLIAIIKNLTTAVEVVTVSAQLLILICLFM